MITNERRTKELSELYQSLSHSKWFRAATCRSTVTERSSQGPEIAGKKPALARRNLSMILRHPPKLFSV